MRKTLASFIDDQEIKPFQDFLFSLNDSSPNPIALQNDILVAFDRYLEENSDAGNMTSGKRFLRKVQEILLLNDHLILVHRHRRANCRIYKLDRDLTDLFQISKTKYLTVKEQLIKPDLPEDTSRLEVNLDPFYDYGPNLKDPDTIGYGIRHLNRYMFTKMAQQPKEWANSLYEFLKLHQLHGVQLLLDGKIIRNTDELESALEDAVDFLDRCDCPENLKKIKSKLRSMGFLEGWGDNAERIIETINLLQDTLEQPNESTLEEFLSRIPMVSKVVLVSPHGWFGQKNVLGRPDTGGQVVYILDQAKALESYITEDFKHSGIDIEPKVLIVTRLIPESEGTTSGQRLEKVNSTRNAYILRVPFREENGDIVPHWISRFRVWPYLDRFTIDAEKEIRNELEGRPDLIVGNYSDGNMVATGLSNNMDVIQCNIAHALEKSKYLFSDLYWQNFEDKYHFSVQFIADIISMNLTNFIITSTRQEIIGTENAIGQYESYQFFTMPGLMKVSNGIDLFHPRFNVIPPGVNEEVFFPFTDNKRRDMKQKELMTELLYSRDDEDCFGTLEHPERFPIFSIARLDRIKNLTGLVEAYAQNQELREQANIIIIASTLNPEQSSDTEEKEEINKMHALIDNYDLHGHIRWIGKFLSKKDTGAAYRVVADRKGLFVQPALFEAFGLTILEAMHSGLPVFATEFGGPQEIIEDGVSGFLINPTQYDAMTESINSFIIACRENPSHWEKYSEAGLKRAQNHFTWKLYCKRLTRLTKVYGFWKFSTSNVAKSRLAQYCHLLYHLIFKARAEKIR